MTNKANYNFTELVLKNQKNNPYFYIKSYRTDYEDLDEINKFSLKNYVTFANTFFTQ